MGRHAAARQTHKNYHHASKRLWIFTGVQLMPTEIPTTENADESSS
jgi:hypothetical protein